MFPVNSKHKSITKVALYCITLAFVSLSVFSYTTSPFYTEPSAGDSAVFQIVGRNWANGNLPYVSLFENKGPIIHFINCLGFLLTGSVLGVFLIQWICLSITLLIIFKILRFGFSIKWSCILLLLPALSFSTGTWGGNCVEEYILPFMSLSYLCIYKWTKNIEEGNIKTHPANYAFVYGMALAFAMLTRLTNALGLCAAVAFIAIWLIIKKSWKNLSQNIISFFIGFAIISVPFFIYFWYKGGFSEMWYDSIISNFSYVTQSIGGSLTIGKAISLFLHFIDTWILLIVAILMLFLNPKRSRVATIWILVSIFSLIWFCSGFAFQHYGVVSLPLIAISLLETKGILVNNKSSKETKHFIRIKRIITIGWAGYSAIIIFLCIHTITFSLANYITNRDLAIVRSFMKDIPSIYKKSFIGYNTPADFYLYDNITPACRFFTTQEFGAQTNPKLKNETYNEFNKKNVQWILVKGNATTINPILKKEYHIYKQDKSKGLILYKINN